jgi:CRP/FNR family cyclic AMP-dependent transcriptional regulator
MDPHKLFTEGTEVVRLRAGQALFRAGDPGDVMYVLISGAADVLVGDDVIERAGPGAFLGELALIDAAPRAATVVATTECRLVSVDKGQFHALIQGTPYFATEVMKVMADRLRRMDDRVAGASGGGRAPASSPIARRTKA